MNGCSKIKLCIAMCFRNTFSLLVCVQAQFLPPCFLTREDEPFPVPSCQQPVSRPPWLQPPARCGSARQPSGTEEHKESKAQPGLPHLSSGQRRVRASVSQVGKTGWDAGVRLPLCQEGARGKQRWSEMGASQRGGLAATSGFLWNPRGRSTVAHVAASRC